MLSSQGTSYFTPPVRYKRKKRSIADQMRMRKAFSKLKSKRTTNNGFVPSTMTTFKLYKSPFPPKKVVNLQTYYIPVPFSGLTTETFQVVNINNLVTQMSAAGVGTPKYANYSPIFFPDLCSATGPYRSYKVISWDCKIIVNSNTTTALSPVVQISPPVAIPGEVTTVGQLANLPGCVRQVMGPSDGANNLKVLRVRGNVSDVYPASANDADLTALYNAAPAKPIYIGIVAPTSAGGGTLVTIGLDISFFVEFQNIDAVSL